MTFKILLRVRYVEHENSLHFKPGMSQHRWLSQSLLLTAAFDRKRLTDGKTRVHVIIGYFVRKYSVWSTRTCSPRFGSRTPIVSSKLRYKRDSSFILEDQCTYPSSLITTPIFVRKRLRALHSTTAEISRTL